MATSDSDAEKVAASELEKALPSSQNPLEVSSNTPDLDEIGELEGYIVDISLIKDKSLAERLKLAKDNRTILIPQPSNDLNDPLNWSSWKKNVTLIVISMTAFLADYGSATGAVALIPQAA